MPVSSSVLVLEEQIPSPGALLEGCLSAPTHPTLTMPLITAMAQTEQVFWQQGRLKAAASSV